ncbi:hypothetical protein JCM3770_002216 [Rhodotorula araucariae]
MASHSPPHSARAPSPQYAPAQPPPPAPPRQDHAQPLRYLAPSHAHANRLHGNHEAHTTGAGRGARSEHGTHTHPAAARPHMPPAVTADDEPSSIRCSSCATWVRLEHLGEHVCASPAGGRRAPPEGLRVDLSGLAGATSPLHAGGAPPPSRYPLHSTCRDENLAPAGQPQPHHLEASSPDSAQLTPTSVTAGGRLPFFDRYQKFVDTAAGGATTAGPLAGLGSARSPLLAPAAGFESGSGPGLASSAPASPLLPTSASAPNLSVPSAASAPHVLPGPGPYRPEAAASPRGEASDFARVQPHRQDPALGRRADVDCDPLTRTPSQSSSASSSGLPYDRDRDSARASIVPSRSTPANLAAYAAAAERGDELNACLDDLRLVATGADDEMLAAFSAGQWDGGECGTVTDALGTEDVLATPRQGPQREKKPEAAPSSQAERVPPRPPGSLQLSPTQPLARAAAHPAPGFSCSACHAPLPVPAAPRRVSDGPPFCRTCYAARFRPKCRKCQRAIEGGAVTSSDGKITGKYHPTCFRCFDCDADFPAGEFYVFDGRPYCQHDYHKHNGSLCATRACGRPIEGECVSLVGEENGGGGRYHPACFTCAEPSCGVPLLSHHFVVDRLPYCDVHAAGPVQRRRVPQAGGAAAARKRMTIVIRS